MQILYRGLLLFLNKLLILNRNRKFYADFFGVRAVGKLLASGFKPESASYATVKFE